MIAKTVRKSVMWPRSQSFFAFWKFQLLYFSFLPTICCIIIIFIANVMQNVEIYNWYCHSEFRKTVPTQQQQKCTTQYLSSGFPGGCNLRIFLSQYISAILQYYISAIPSTEYQRNIIQYTQYSQYLSTKTVTMCQHNRKFFLKNAFITTKILNTRSLGALRA